MAKGRFVESQRQFTERQQRLEKQFNISQQNLERAIVERRIEADYGRYLQSELTGYRVRHGAWKEQVETAMWLPPDKRKAALETIGPEPEIPHALRSPEMFAEQIEEQKELEIPPVSKEFRERTFFPERKILLDRIFGPIISLIEGVRGTTATPLREPTAREGKIRRELEGAGFEPEEIERLIRSGVE